MNHWGIMEPQADQKCEWYGTVSSFLGIDLVSWGTALTSRLLKIGLPVDNSQKSAWINCFEKLKKVLPKVLDWNSEIGNWLIIFEYELLRERGRRPDVLLLSDKQIYVLEFKQSDYAPQSYLDQVSAYARDIKNYHALSHEMEVIPILVLSNSVDFFSIIDDVKCISPDQLLTFIQRASMNLSQ